ncbi:Nucleolar protein-like protein [Hapsidospora chrysogenum ATCC 11550]|uniref:Nucleolar protein 56 n=1 Tax=Hapsidospora chrysogenum (strain ATCC 11550 / CBS 779.69 / DSM 880 / IAM 14645 / JCM 23072 / IMI 49137) TaxID=857340 RepID=A0A086T9L9_HAPC1|nr:Nucleolar protein-like protein [Hapsidospora chrysogenum ATCC 11550]
MSEVDYALYEAPVGYALFKVVHQADVVGLKSKEGQEAATDLAKFGKMIKLQNFSPFRGQKEALENVNEISEGQMPDYLKEVLELNLPKTSGKKAQVILGVAEKNLAGSIKATFPGIACKTADTSDVVAELLRGIRLHAEKLIEGLNSGDIEQAGRGLGHAYSRGRIMFDPKRNDRSIIEAIKTVDMADKFNNNNYMRLREWYGWHFPELSKIVSDNYTYAMLIKTIRDKKTLNDDRLHEIAAVVGEDGEKAQAIIDAAKVSMGREISEEDHEIIEATVKPLNSAFDLRKSVALQLEKTLENVAPNLQILVGTIVAARLIEAAQGLSNLAKMPASTLQILGAEKALFRALKAKSNTPKYGLIFHSTFIGRASTRDKGRISRYLANKCTIACRIDYFSPEPSTKWGKALKQQVEDRLEFYATGKRPAKNADVMASVEALGGLADEGVDLDEDEDMADVDATPAKADKESKKSKKDKKDKKDKKEKKEKKRKRVDDDEEEAAAPAEDDGEKKKKKKKKSKSSDDA